MQALAPLRLWKRRLHRISIAILLAMVVCDLASAQQSSVSTWESASFRTWSFVPYWTSQSQLESFPADGLYDHVSDVLYFSGVRPTSTGHLNYHPWAAQHLATLGSHAAQHNFRYHMSMFDTFGGDVETVWNSIVSNPTNRATFVTQVTNLLQANGMTGFNLDWERPNTVAEWANYTQLAQDLKDMIGPLGMEVSVDDYGFTDSRWDDTPVFDGKIYDQLFIMGYHYPAYSGDSLNHNSFANGKLALTGQGAEKAFTEDQLVLGIGTWGKGPSGTKPLKEIAAADPNLPFDATTWTDGINTWTIESREQVRAKIQLALDRNMPGVMNWTLHYDSPTELGLHRVAHHYLVFQRDVPDLNLDGLVDGADAETLSDNMGAVPGWTGVNTAARFDNFYRQGNWERGDHNGNGFVNQADADWLASRFGSLGVNLPDRLAYTGTFEDFQNGPGLVDRWRVLQDGNDGLQETGNFTQHGSGFLTFNGSGAGFDKHSDTSITIRNQNAAEAFDSLNTAPRELEVGLSAPIDLSDEIAQYFTFLVRQNTSPLLASQLASNQRNLFLQFNDALGVNQFDVSLSGLNGEVAIDSRADLAGDDVSTTGFLPDLVYLVIGKISGNSLGANQVDLSFFPDGASVGDFTDGAFSWMLTANSSPGFDPVITNMQMVSLYESNYTVSNIQIGEASRFFDPMQLGDFDADDDVDGFDFLVWQRGESANSLSSSDLAAWESHYAAVSPSAALSAVVPEPANAFLPISVAVICICFRFRRCAA